MKIKLLTETAKKPTRGSEQAAGLDLYSDHQNKIIIMPQTMHRVHTGIALEIPEGYFGGIFARSGLAMKHGGRPANCVGVIDSDYRGEVIVGLYNDSTNALVIEPGEKIAQLILIPYHMEELEVVEELETTERGENGFGSTGKF